MTTSSTLLSNKLSLIRDSSPIRWAWRYTRNIRLIPVLTVSLMCSILAINILTSYTHTIQSAQSSIPLWVGDIKQLIQGIQKYDQNTLDELKSSLKQTIMPLTLPFGVRNYTYSEIDSVFDELSNILKVIEPLGQYTLSSSGFVHPFSQSRFVTDDLKLVFEALEPIIQRINSHWQSLGWFFWIGQPLFDNEIIFLSNFVTLMLRLGRQVIDNQDAIAALLGGDSTKRYVIVTQNTAESRPSGGFMGSYTPIDISKGRVVIGESKPISEMTGSMRVNYINNLIPQHYFSNIFDNAQTNTSGNSNTSACFKDTAKRIIDALARSRVGYHVEGAIYLNPGFIDTLIPSGTTFQLKDTTIDASGLFDYIDRKTGVGTGETLDSVNPKSIIDDIGKVVLNTFSNVLRQIDPFELVNRILLSFHTRQIQMYMSNTQVQGIMEELHFAGNQTCQNESSLPILTPYMFNLADKRDRDLTHTFIINTKRVWGGVRYSVTHRYNSPEQFSSNRGFFHRLVRFVGLQIPLSAIEVTASSLQHLDYEMDQTSYNQFLHLDSKEFYATDDDQKVLDSYRYVGHSLRFNQTDGSKVAGLFVFDEAVTEINYSFILPTQSKAFLFYPQAGMENVKLSLGSGAGFYYDRLRTIIEDQLTIQLGVPILTK